MRHHWTSGTSSQPEEFMKLHFQHLRTAIKYQPLYIFYPSFFALFTLECLLKDYLNLKAKLNTSISIKFPCWVHSSLSSLCKKKDFTVQYGWDILSLPRTIKNANMFSWLSIINKPKKSIRIETHVSQVLFSAW